MGAPPPQVGLAMPGRFAPAPYLGASDHLADQLQVVLCMIKRHLALRGHRLLQADGKANDLYVSLNEATAVLSGTTTLATETLLRKLGWPSVHSVEEDLGALFRRIERRCLDTESLSDPPRLPLQLLRTRFHLSERQLRLILCAAAPLLRVDIARIYTFAWGDFATKQPTVGFLTELASDRHTDPLEMLSEFGPESPLIQNRLLLTHDVTTWGHPTPLLHRGVSVPDRIVSWIISDSAELANRDTHWQDSKPTQRPEDLVLAPQVREQVEAGWLAARTNEHTSPRLILIGPRGVGRRTLWSCLTQSSGQGLLVVDLLRLPTEEPLFESALRDISCEAALRGCAMLWRADEFLETESERLLRLAGTLRRVATDFRGPLAVTAPRAAPWLRRALEPMRAIEFPLPAVREQAAIWRRSLAEVGAERGLAGNMVQRFHLAPGVILSAVRKAESQKRDTPLRVEDLCTTIRYQTDHQLSQLAEPFSTTLTWDDMVLPAETLEQIQEIIAHARLREKVFDRWGFRRKVSYGRGLSCLFFGPPGTGKTMMAAILAHTLGREMYRVDLSRVASKWIGETEKNLARVFQEAEQAQVILLFDEADSLFSKRTEVKSSNDRFANMEINYLLQRMESFDGMTILTTNFESSIDEAFRRRLRFRIQFPLPDWQQRAQLWAAMLPMEATVEADIPFEELGQRFEMSGGNIKNAVLKAAFFAAHAGTPITYDLLQLGAVQELQEMGRLV